MVSLNTLYAQAEQQNIPVLRFPMPGCESMSIQLPDGSCAIGLDSAPGTETGERVHLSHELGHCLTGSFYNIYAAADLRARHENRADKWAIRRLIPVAALDDAIASGHTDLWDLADYFGVTESFLKKPSASTSTATWPRNCTFKAQIPYKHDEPRIVQRTEANSYHPDLAPPVGELFHPLSLKNIIGQLLTII